MAERALLTADDSNIRYGLPVIISVVTPPSKDSNMSHLPDWVNKSLSVSVNVHTYPEYPYPYGMYTVNQLWLTIYRIVKSLRAY